MGDRSPYRSAKPCGCSRAAGDAHRESRSDGDRIGITSREMAHERTRALDRMVRRGSALGVITAVALAAVFSLEYGMRVLILASVLAGVLGMLFRAATWSWRAALDEANLRPHEGED